MTNELESEKNLVEETEFVDEEVELKFHWIFLGFFIIYFNSFLIPGIIVMLYIFYYFIPSFLRVESFIVLFASFEPLFVVIITPIFLIGCYLLHLVLATLVTRWLWAFTERRSPSKEGIIPRNINSKALNYYTIRAFLIKYGKNAFIKGPFPWLTKWYYNTVKSNIIGKGTTIEESVTGDKFVEVGENCYIGVDANLASHLVEGIKGRVNYFKVKVGNNCTFAATGGLTPGCEAGDNTYFLPYVSAFKHTKIGGNNFYFGTPPRKITKKKTVDELGITTEDYEKERALREQQLKSKTE